MGLLARLSGKTPEPRKSSSNTKPTALYRGVQIVPGSEGCCGEAKMATSRRYLSHEIQRLPLESCDFVNCQCTYKLFDDRRTDLRRTSDISFDLASSLRIDEDQRREACDRRKTS